MPRRDEQSQRWELVAQPKKNSGQDFFFAAMRAATEEDEAFHGAGGRLPERRSDRHALCLNVGVEFDAAVYMNSVGRNTQCRPSLYVLPFWYTHQIEQPERWRDKKTEPSIASLRAWRQSRIDQREGDSARARCGSEVRPDLCLNKNNPHRTN